MSVTLPQFNNIKEFLQKDPTGSYEEWVNQYKPKREKKKSIEPYKDKGFKQFWDAYPSTANFAIRGMKFTSSRVLRSNYQVCEILYLKALQAYNLDPAQILKALQIQLNLIKKESYETGQNKLQYFPGIEVYLRQGKFDAFLQQTFESQDEIEMGFTTDHDYSSNSA